MEKGKPLLCKYSRFHVNISTNFNGQNEKLWIQ